MRRTTLACCLFILSANLLQAQSVNFFNEYVNQPSVWRPAKSITPGVGPDGDLNLSIPILTIPGRNGLNYTVQLSYRSSIKGTQEASWIGLGWSFDPGSITRDVQGGVIFPHNTVERIGPVDVYTVDYEDQQPLYQPDMYYVTTPAGSFSMTRATFPSTSRPGDPSVGIFYPDKWRPWQISFGMPQPVMVTDPLYQITDTTKSFVNHPMQGDTSAVEKDIPNFTLTAEDGTRYIFEHPTLATYILNLPSETDVMWYLQHYVSTWRLAAILGPDYPGGGVGDLPDPENNPSDNAKPGSWVRFYYDDVRITRPLSNKLHAGIENLLVDRHRTRQVAYLRSIHTPTHRAEFEVDTRPGQHDDTYIWQEDLLKRLKRIDLYAKGAPDQLVRAMELVHNDTLRGLSPPIMGFERRMALEAIKFFDSNDSEEPGYTFDYISAYAVTTYNELYLNNRDDFGYFNEEDRENTAHPGTLIDNTDGGANDDGTAWSLKAITYPTGGQADIFYENDAIGTCDASPGSGLCLHLEYESYWDAVYHPGNPPIPGKPPVTATRPYDVLYNYNRRQGGARVTKIVRSDGLSPEPDVVTYHYGEGRVSGVPEAEWPRAAITFIPSSVPSYHQPSDRGAASVYYTWVEQRNQDSTFTRTYYTTDASCPANLSCGGPQGDIMPQQATFFLRLNNTSVAEGNQHINWGIPYETVQGVHGQTEEMHRRTLRELAVDRGQVALAFDYSDTATVYVDYRLGNATLERETLFERDENDTLSVVLERVYEYDFGAVDTGLPLRVEETANASRTRVTETLYGYHIDDYDDGLLTANILNIPVRVDTYEQAGSSTLYHGSTVTTLQRFDAGLDSWCPLETTSDSCPWRARGVYRWNAAAPASSSVAFNDWDPGINPSGAWQTQALFNTYDAYGHVLEQEDALGRLTHFFYGNNNAACSNSGDPLHHASLTCVQRDTLAQTMGYDDRLRLAAIADANADTTRFEYDPLGRLQKTRNVAGEVVGENVYTTLGVFPQSVETLTRRSDTDVTRAITFYDGLGRPVQTQLKERDTQVIVSAVDYDVQGRDSLGWKPYPLSTSLLDYDDFYAANAQAYYDALYAGGVTPHTATEYTIDGLSQVARVTPPYTATIATVEQEQSMKMHDGAMYASSRTTEEDGTITDVYADGFGNTVASIAGVNSLEEATTEFRYDIMGNLLTVMPPNYFAPPSGIPSDWETTYQYNTLGQLASKTTPDTHNGPGGSGKGTFNYAYDAVGNLRLVEDPNRAGNGYLYTEYDAFNRVVETGLCDGGSFTTNPGTDSCPSGTKAEVVTYAYDTSTPSEPLAGLTVNNPNGRRIQVKFDGDYYQYSYDDEGRVEAMHIYLDGLGDKLMAYAYDRQGNVTKVSYQADSVDALHHWYTYDGAGRLEAVKTNVLDDTTTAVREAHYMYTPTGQVEQLLLGADQVAVPPITYDYHIRDWLTKINDPMSLGGNQFAMELGYEDDLFTPALPGTGYKNGNVTSMMWQTRGNVGPTATDTLLGYGFTYDALNRLTVAATQSYQGSWQPVSSYEVPVVQYDPNGNITTLQRLDAAGSGTAITYTYEIGRNRLQSVGGSVSATFDYDANGNMKEGRGINEMDYDRRNLPVLMEVGVDSLRFRYDADGQRVYKQLLNANGSVETFYVRGAGGSVVAVYTKTSEGVRWYWNILSGGTAIGRVEPPGPGPIQ